MLLLDKNDAPSKRAKVPATNDAIVGRNDEIVDTMEAELSDEIFSEAKAIVKHFLSTVSQRILFRDT